MQTINTQTPSRFNPAAVSSRPPPTSRTALPPNLQPVCNEELAAATQPQAPVTSGVRKVSFGNIPAPKVDSKKTVYPVFPDPNGLAGALAATIVRQSEELESLEGSLITNKAELKFMVAPAYFQLNHGKHEVPSSVAVNSPDGEVLVNFQNRYKVLPDESPIQQLLGAERTEKYFRQAFELKVNGDLIPVERAQELLDELVALFTRYDCAAALEAKSCIKPIKEFHAARHLILSNEENIALEQVCPIVAGVKTKGRKK